MKKIMLKLLFSLPIVALTVLACSSDAMNLFRSKKAAMQIIHFDENGYADYDGVRIKKDKDTNRITYYGTKSSYGAYLAGRVAHLRSDMTNAVEYYKIMLEKNPDNSSVNRIIYLLMTSDGNISEAKSYAQHEIDSQDYGVMAPLIVAAADLAQNNYDNVHKILALKNDQLYVSLIYPFINAWAYAGENNKQAAFDEIAKIEDKGHDLIALKLFHKGLIHEYFGETDKAMECFNTIITVYPKEVNFRRLEVITDFYIRNNRYEDADILAKKYIDDSLLSVILADIQNQIKTKKSSPNIRIDTPQKGVADVMFGFNVMFRLAKLDNSFALIFDAISIYLNPEYDATKISMANVLEEIGYYEQANKYYRQVSEQSGYAYLAKTHLILNLLKEDKKDEATVILKELLAKYPENPQLLAELADITYDMGETKEAIKIYEQAIKHLQAMTSTSWTLYYSLGAAYDKDKQSENAEKMMFEALNLSNRDASVLNYIGYSWLDRNKNTDKAISMILEAYNKYPLEGHIVDSLGWAFYKIGYYDKAVEYLEQASDMNPANAVISDHLGDAYWMQGRKNEAVFQWKHSLSQKEDADLLDKKVIQNKIESGMPEPTPIEINDADLLSALNEM
ncbi:MAG: tetratricopeptide repeat protein [Alphaproteobacteria bacterium]|nr:tetratricopeptide repeat protein [Alphaproteobacteria bacterium]